MNIKNFLEKGFLISPDAIKILKDEENNNIQHINKKILKENLVVLNKDIFNILNNGRDIISINWREFERSKTLVEKGKNNKIYHTFLDLLNYEEKKERISRIFPAGIAKPKR